MASAVSSYIPSHSLSHHSHSHSHSHGALAHQGYAAMPAMHPEHAHDNHADSDSSADEDAFNYEAYSQYSAPGKKGDKNERSLTISTNAPMGGGSPSSKSSKDSSKGSPRDKDLKGDPQRPEHLKPRLCTVPGCKKRVRSKGLCKAHGGGRRCMVEGCERSSQGQGLCIRHGGGKRCTQPGCTKASQSNGLCKAHGGGLRCMAATCTKSSQGGGFCRAHGGGQRCEKEGCNKGAQRGGFCAGHGGSRFCQHPDCTKNDRGGGYCAEHGGGKRCDQQGCNKPARKRGKCSYHANANKQKAPKEAMPASAAPPMMDMRQITAPAYNGMAGMSSMPKEVTGGMRDSMDQHPSIRSSYPPVSSYQQRVDMDQRYAKGYDQPLPLSTNSASSQYLPIHADQRGYEAMGLQQQASRHYMNSMDASSLPSVSSGYSAQHKHQPVSASMSGMDRGASQYNPQREMMKPTSHVHQYSHWAPQTKDPVAPGGMPDRSNLDYFDMKDQAAAHHAGYGGASAAQYHHHLSAADSAAAAAAYGNQRDNYYHHAPSAAPEQAGAPGMMYNSYGYQPHQMHNMSSMNLL